MGDLIVGDPVPKHDVKRWEYVTREGVTLVCYAPSLLAARQLVELHLGREASGLIRHVPLERAVVTMTDERKAPGR